VEQQGATGLAERQVAQFIKDNQVDMGKPVCQASLPGVELFQLQGIDQSCGAGCGLPHIHAHIVPGLLRTGKDRCRLVTAGGWGFYISDRDQSGLLRKSLNILYLLTHLFNNHLKVNGSLGCLRVSGF